MQLHGNSFYTHRPKDSFQYGSSVFFTTPVVLVCSPLTVATANGSGRAGNTCISMVLLDLGRILLNNLLFSPSAAITGKR